MVEITSPLLTQGAFTGNIIGLHLKHLISCGSNCIRDDSHRKLSNHPLEIIDHANPQWLWIREIYMHTQVIMMI